MEKTYNLFKKFLPMISIIAFCGMGFALLSLLFYYNEATISIDFKNVIPIMAVLFLLAAFAACVYFTLKIDKLHITRIKKTSGFTKFSVFLVGILATALFLYNFLQFVLQPVFTLAVPATLFKTLRMGFSIQFIVYLALEILPKKIKHKAVIIPKWIKPFMAVCTLIWAIFGLLGIYFFTGLPTTNIFKLAYIFYYVLVIIFFYFEIKFELLTPNHRGYVLSAMLLFSFTFIFSGSMTFAKFLGRLSNVTISDFEIFLSVALGIYALAKMMAIQNTLKFVMSRNEGSGRHRHHRHHRSSSTTENIEPATIQIEDDSTSNK